ncbi:MAG TPA: EDSAP-1 family PEP-CTERM protein, partial [Janthinobacterium sp.]|nr:EDSAP-1 family PEP-CTERM protein [Janthinobacterium sp.]
GAVTIGPNNFTQQGQGPAAYSRGDAQIVSTQFPPFPVGATSTQAVNAAESYVPASGTADASGRNGSTTGFSVNFVVGSPTATIAFNFLADPYMQVFLSALAGPGSASAANLVVTFTITNAAGVTVFNWAPDGLLGSGITGGTETADGANLNINLSTNTLTAGTLFTYDPTACGAITGTGVSTACGAAFAALSTPLTAGGYTLTLNAVESTDIVITQQVPEPGTLALLGLGLAGLCLGSRRKL